MSNRTNINLSLSLVGFYFLGIQKLLLVISGIMCRYDFKLAVPLFVFMISWLFFGLFNSLFYVIMSFVYELSFRKELVSKITTKLFKTNENNTIVKAFNNVPLVTNQISEYYNKFETMTNWSAKLDVLDKFLGYLFEKLKELILRVPYANIICKYVTDKMGCVFELSKCTKEEPTSNNTNNTMSEEMIKLMNTNMNLPNDPGQMKLPTKKEIEELGEMIHMFEKLNDILLQQKEKTS